jgi:hypothetical protein
MTFSRGTGTTLGWMIEASLMEETRKLWVMHSESFRNYSIFRLSSCSGVLELAVNAKGKEKRVSPVFEEGAAHKASRIAPPVGRHWRNRLTRLKNQTMQSGDTDRLPLVGPGVQEPIRKQTSAAGAPRSSRVDEDRPPEGKIEPMSMHFAPRQVISRPVREAGGVVLPALFCGFCPALVGDQCDRRRAIDWTVGHRVARPSSIASPAGQRSGSRAHFHVKR